MGRIPKPNQIRINEGNREHRPIHPEAQHKHGAPERPPLSASAKCIWDRLIEDMDPLILRRADKDALATLCEDEARLAEAHAEFERLREKLKLEAKQESRKLVGGGLAEALTSKEGKAIFRSIREYTKSLIVQRREFGLTPASRTRVMAGEAPKGWIDDAVFSNAADLLVLQKPS